MTIYADELREGLIANIAGAAVHLHRVKIMPEINVVFTYGYDIVTGRLVIPPPFTLANLIEVFDA